MKKSKLIKNILLLILLLILIVGGIAAYVYTRYTDAIFNPNSTDISEVKLNVKAGDNINSLAPQLQSAGLIKSSDFLKLYLKTNNVSPNVKIGEYSIPKNLTVPQLIEILEKGVQKKNFFVQIREGLRDDEIGKLITDQFKLSYPETKFSLEKFLDICKYPSKYSLDPSVLEFLKKYQPENTPILGFLYPDTYRFDYDSSEEIVVSMIVKNFIQKLKDKNVDLDNLPGNKGGIKSIYDALKLASIVQKEAGSISDMPTIAGVFHNRLAQNYPLQSDVTINFIKGTNDIFISINDTKIQSEYNTYLNAGLTPTPINNPGIDAIMAVIKPADTNYFFFLYDKNGVVYYAETFAQHQINVQNHLN